MVASAVYEKRAEKVSLRLTNSERRMAQECADREGISLTRWLTYGVRRLLGLPSPGSTH